MSQACGLQETEDLRLDPEIASKGVAALLKDPAKGRYFVLEVRTHAQHPSGNARCFRGSRFGLEVTHQLHFSLRLPLKA